MEKFKIEIELTKKQIENIRALGCVGLCVGNDGRAESETYSDMALFIEKLNKVIGDDFGINCLLDEEGMKPINEKIIMPYLRFIIPSIFKFKNISELLEECK